MQSDLADRLRQNLEEVRERMSQAAGKASRPVDEVRLAAVTKYADDDQVKALYELGQRDFGESRPLDARPRIESMPGDCRWHMIGHLQRNKAKNAIDGFVLVHSVDSERLLRKLHEEMRSRRPGATLPVLLEVNVSGESSKSGFAHEEAERALELINELAAETDGPPALEPQGLMTMAPYSENPESARPVFAALRELRDRLATPDRPLGELSMGMSGDYTVAIEEGATIVRVGSALFK